MSKYKDWKDDQIAILEYYGEFSHITKEDLYQEFKERLFEEVRNDLISVLVDDE